MTRCEAALRAKRRPVMEVIVTRGGGSEARPEASAPAQMEPARWEEVSVDALLGMLGTPRANRLPSASLFIDRHGPHSRHFPLHGAAPAGRRRPQSAQSLRARPHSRQPPAPTTRPASAAQSRARAQEPPQRPASAAARPTLRPSSGQVRPTAQRPSSGHAKRPASAHIHPSSAASQRRADSLRSATKCSASSPTHGISLGASSRPTKADADGRLATFPLRQLERHLATRLSRGAVATYRVPQHAPVIPREFCAAMQHRR